MSVLPKALWINIIFFGFQLGVPSKKIFLSDMSAKVGGGRYCPP